MLEEFIMKKMINLFILVSAIMAGLFIFSGCSTITPEELQDKLIMANTGIEKYSLDMNMDTNMVVKMDSKEMTVTSTLDSKGYFDNTKKTMMLKGTAVTMASGMKQESEIESYVVDNFLYSKSGIVWMKMELSDDIWNQQNQISQMVELAKSGKLTLQKDETIDGKNYYVATLEPDIKKMVEIALQSQIEAFEQLDLNLEEMIKDYSSTLWINKETFVIEKSKSYVRMELPSDMFGTGSVGVSENPIIISNVELKIYDIGKELSITLPEEAKDAQDFSELMTMYQDSELETDSTFDSTSESFETEPINQ